MSPILVVALMAGLSILPALVVGAEVRRRGVARGRGVMRCS